MSAGEKLLCFYFFPFSSFYPMNFTKYCLLRCAGQQGYKKHPRYFFCCLLRKDSMQIKESVVITLASWLIVSGTNHCSWAFCVSWFEFTSPSYLHHPPWHLYDKDSEEIKEQPRSTISMLTYNSHKHKRNHSVAKRNQSTGQYKISHFSNLNRSPVATPSCLCSLFSSTIFLFSIATKNTIFDG